MSLDRTLLRELLGSDAGLAGASLAGEAWSLRGAGLLVAVGAVRLDRSGEPVEAGALAPVAASPKPARRLPERNESMNIRLFVIIAAAVFAMPAHAYLDPSTGSMIISAIIGVFASIALAVKTYWYKIKSFFKGGNDSSDSAPEEPGA